MITNYIKIQIACLFIGATISLLFSCNQQESPEEVSETSAPATAPMAREQQKETDKAVLVGDWERTDAPYQLRISELPEDGTIKASYFNPKSIHVGKATWVIAEGFLKIYVELRDENYPGSNYTLTYYAEKDVLIGKYYQAVEGATYEVNFARKK